MSEPRPTDDSGGATPGNATAHSAWSAAGSAGAWVAEALRRFEGPLLRYAAGLCGDADAARDVVQETFLRLCERMDGSRPRAPEAPTAEPTGAPENMAAWLFAVCRSRALDVRRKEKRVRPLLSSEACRSDAPGASRGGPARADDAGGPLRLRYPEDPQLASENHDLASHALRLLERLPENQREAVQLKFQAGLSYKEIAHTLGLSVTNVGFLLHTALKTLRAALADEPADRRMP